MWIYKILQKGRETKESTDDLEEKKQEMFKMIEH